MTVLLDHVNVRCSDLEATKAFFETVVGLEEGQRPNFPFPGYWLYSGGQAVVHLVEMKLSGAPAGRGTVDHFAFRGGDYETQMAAISAAGLKTRENRVAELDMRQVFVSGPDDVVVELQFVG
ncbi:MAG: VOC family protein [Minwuia sp.]|uniref:VOC family protein n=1 Tax=Minwuia sp. TaxID=2493630 RepID=UPI003A840B2C